MRTAVIITSHNYKEFVGQAVQSALEQTATPHEVIIVDDGSTDGSPELLKERFGHDPRVRIIATANAGQLAAFRRGVAECSGDVVAFLDADDYWERDHLERGVRIFQSRPEVDFVFTNVALTGAASGVWHDEAQDRDFGIRVLQAYFLHPWIGSPTSGLMLRRRLCQRVLEVPDDMLGDWKTRADDCLVYGAGILGAYKVYAARPTVRYRIHDANRWYGQQLRKGADLDYLWRVNALADFYGRKAGLGVLPPMSVLMEFKSLDRPALGDLWFYLRLLGKVPWGPGMHLRQGAAMCLHFLRIRLRPAAK
jgi:glycosyltransferase involved in cell wall biosynthesis